MPFSLTEITKLSCGIVTMVVVTLLWVHRSSQQNVSRTSVAGFKIALRIFLVQMGFAYVFCRIFSVPVDVYLTITSVIFLLATAVSLDSIPADNAVGLGISMLFMLPLYILKQFVLGFPDRDLVILSPPSLSIEISPPPRRTNLGVVVSTLRPMGTIELAGERFNAVSDTGVMIDVGTQIRVTGHRGNMFLVSRTNTEAS